MDRGNIFQGQMELLERKMFQPEPGMCKCQTELKAIFNFDVVKNFLGKDFFGG